ncbi:SMI1/KNR4 family protein [Geobacillus icigianus]|uniref:Antitoxin YobK n=1 Tax=Geobacillus subterraneus TaxID=129338 RepID=A0A679FQ10_9BACL|nr:MULTISPECIES: SMI1/KNR4 family protein [Geobacillus]KYD24867.1 hypothetical protein B4113_2116 [Geobacillus sp. B4113_201601]BBW98608.1 antitoxin YobK [Geobacillus subterraneus]
MNEKELTALINENMEPDDFTGGVAESEIKRIQNELGVMLPKSYQWFLMNYGSGGMFGIDILGIGKSNLASVVIETKRYRELGLDRHLVVIENCGEYVYCLDTRKMENNECPVIAWDRQQGIDEMFEANNFFEFLWERLADAKEAWEEDF